MKVTVSITAENGDTQVRKIEVPEVDDPLKFTKYYAANKIMNRLAGEILDIIHVFQEVEDRSREDNDIAYAPVIDHYVRGFDDGSMDRLSGQDSSEGSADNEVYRRGYVAGYKNAQA